MQITTLDELKEYTSIYNYKYTQEVKEIKKVYIVQPRKNKDGKLLPLYIWTGTISYNTNALSKEVGYYQFNLDKDDSSKKELINKNPIYLKLCPLYVECILAKVQSENNCNKFPELKRLQLFLTNDNKHVFTTYNEANIYVNNIKDKKIII